MKRSEVQTYLNKVINITYTKDGIKGVQAATGNIIALTQEYIVFKIYEDGELAIKLSKIVKIMDAPPFFHLSDQGREIPPQIQIMPNPVIGKLENLKNT